MQFRSAPDGTLPRLRHRRRDDHLEPHPRLHPRRADRGGAWRRSRRRRLLRRLPRPQPVPPPVRRRRVRRCLHPALRQALSWRGRRGRRRAPLPSRPLPGSRWSSSPSPSLANSSCPGCMLLLAPWLCRRPGQIRPRRPAGPHRAPLSALHVAGRALFRRAQRARALCRRGLRPEPAQRRAHRRAAHADRHWRRRAEHGRGCARLGHRRVGACCR